jgi:hypothetical protein
VDAREPRAEPGPETEGRLLLWANGQEQPLWSPNSDEFWAWTTQYVLEYARISAEDPHLMGVFLDYENYAPKPKPGNLYDLSYDDMIMARFAEARGSSFRSLSPTRASRGSRSRGCTMSSTPSRSRTGGSAAERCASRWTRSTRASSSASTPRRARRSWCARAYPEWATEAAPIILADASTYGRPSRLRPQEEGLEINRQRLIERQQVAVEAMGVPFIYTGGIDPAVTGADPEFSGKNAVMISFVTDGYWIFYEGPTYDTTHPEYFRWFTWANQAIAEGNLEAWRGPREEPEDLGLTLFGSAGVSSLVAPPITGERVDYPTVRLRRENLLVLAAEAGRPVEIVLANLQVGAARGADGLGGARPVEPARGHRAGRDLNAPATVAFTPETTGIYTLGASGRLERLGGGERERAGRHLDRRAASLFTPTAGMYFHVPEGVEEFSIIATGVGGRDRAPESAGPGWRGGRRSARPRRSRRRDRDDPPGRAGGRGLVAGGRARRHRRRSRTTASTCSRRSRWCCHSRPSRSSGRRRRRPRPPDRAGDHPDRHGKVE